MYSASESHCASAYHILSFVPKHMQEGALAQVISDGPEICYQIASFPDDDAVYVHHIGPLTRTEPIVVFRDLGATGAGDNTTFTFHNKKEKKAGALLTTVSECVLRSLIPWPTSHANCQ